MARSTKVSESPAPTFDRDLYEASPEPSQTRANYQSNSMSPSPARSVSSDKENSSSRIAIDKGKGRVSMGPPRAPADTVNKRKRTVDRETHAERDRSRRRRTAEVGSDGGGNDGDSDFYDPDQSIDERRELRRGLRELGKSLSENRSEFLDPNSTGLRSTLIRANELAEQVKQTSDATIDSRLLAEAADQSLKRTVALTSGDTAQGVDIDDFIGKCINFMRVAEGADEDDEAAPSSTQRRRRKNHADEEDDGDQLNWAHLGRFACLKYNARPSVPGFLLGPLSREKRAKKIVARKAALKINSIRETRPEVLQSEDIERAENENLTTLCTQILARLRKVKLDAMNAVMEQTDEEMTEQEADRLLDKYGVSRNGGLTLFKFVINPHSFGQTIENLFYVSFLIRDGKLGVSEDERGLPYLDITEPRSGSDARGGGPSKHQAVLALDMTTWKELIDIFDIKEPMIRHREEQDYRRVGAKGWYA